jgi:hypothetical protein
LGGEFRDRRAAAHDAARLPTAGKTSKKIVIADCGQLS